MNAILKPKFRHALPQIEGGTFITDGGLETTLIHDMRVRLPYFSAFPLMKVETGRNTLKRYFDRYLQLAAERGVGFILDTPTWRANADWGAKIGYDQRALDQINRASAIFMSDMRRKFEEMKVVLSGVIGPRSDRYAVDKKMSVADAQKYHRAQVSVFAETAIDVVTALTMTNIPEATGIVLAAKAAGIPVVVSFTLETNGCLPSGETLADAISIVDAATDRYAAYFMIDCAHPTHFMNAVQLDSRGKQRVRGIRAKASSKSHTEVNAANTHDSSSPEDLAKHYQELRRHFPQANVLGGCCGADHRHIVAICNACAI